MDKREIMDIMSSDMKLWDRAETTNLGAGKITKSLDLSCLGIPTTESTVTLEGLKNAGKKREAVSSYGAYIRGLVKERIDDEAVTARAKAAAARREQAGGGDSDSVSADSGLRDEGFQEASLQGASEAHEEAPEDDADFGASLAARRTALRERIGRVEADLTKWKRELKGLDAAIAAMEEDDASEDSGETDQG